MNPGINRDIEDRTGVWYQHLSPVRPAGEYVGLCSARFYVPAGSPDQSAVVLLDFFVSRGISKW